MQLGYTKKVPKEGPWVIGAEIGSADSGHAYGARRSAVESCAKISNGIEISSCGASIPADSDMCFSLPTRIVCQSANTCTECWVALKQLGGVHVAYR